VGVKPVHSSEYKKAAPKERNSLVRRSLYAVLAVAVLSALAIAPQAAPFQSKVDVSGLQCIIFAPDWTWRGRDVNVLFVAANEGDTTREVRIALALPPGEGARFGRSGTPVSWPKEDLLRTLDVPPDHTERLAFAGITPLPSLPLGAYPFQLTVMSGGDTVEIPFSVRIIRGQIIQGGQWVAVLVPVSVALVWCIAFAVALSRLAPAGAWKRPSQPMTEPETDA
jgi:hypothetical protein